MTPRERHEWSSLVTISLAPCPDVPVSVAQCVQEKRARAARARRPPSGSPMRCARARPRRRSRRAYKEPVRPGGHQDPAAGRLAHPRPGRRAGHHRRVRRFRVPALPRRRCRCSTRSWPRTRTRCGSSTSAYTLPFHAARRARRARGVRCGPAGKFWEMEHLLFERQQHLEHADLERYARDAQARHREVEGRTWTSPAAKDAPERRPHAWARTSSSKGTPTIYVNGRELDVEEDESLEERVAARARRPAGAGPVRRLLRGAARDGGPVRRAERSAAVIVRWGPVAACAVLAVTASVLPRSRPAGDRRTTRRTATSRTSTCPGSTPHSSRRARSTSSRSTCASSPPRARTWRSRRPVRHREARVRRVPCPRRRRSRRRCARGWPRDQVEDLYKERFDASTAKASPLDGSPSRGPEDAPVALVEFADFECPFCQQIAPELDALWEKRQDKVRFVYKFMPLSMHPHGEIAARAAIAAQTQGKFWEMHHLLFANGAAPRADADLEKYAAAVGLDSTASAPTCSRRRRRPASTPTASSATTLQVKGTPDHLHRRPRVRLEGRHRRVARQRDCGAQGERM